VLERPWPSRTLQEVKCIIDPLLVEVGSIALAKGAPEPLADGVASWSAELNGSQRVLR